MWVALANHLELGLTIIRRANVGLVQGLFGSPKWFSQIGQDAFKKLVVFETGISDYHGLVISVMKSHLPRLKPKIIKYRSYKTLDENIFLLDVELANF